MLSQSKSETTKADSPLTGRRLLRQYNPRRLSPRHRRTSFTFNKDGSSASRKRAAGARPESYLFPLLPVDRYAGSRSSVPADDVCRGELGGEVGDGTWMVGQAPGLVLLNTRDDGADDENVTPIVVGDRTLRGSSEGSWTTSWARHWTPLPDGLGGTGNGADTHSSGGISTGAKAGIGVGAGVSGLIITGIAGWALMLRRRKQRISDAAVQPRIRAIVSLLQSCPQRLRWVYCPWS
ncbi:hypothetical protein BDV06DRAFT_67463 [Aspergillus oleicola]